jgi:hypothetical protein
MVTGQKREAKDEGDDLEVEIRKKFAKGYPLNDPIC